MQDMRGAGIVAPVNGAGPGEVMPGNPTGVAVCGAGAETASMVETAESCIETEKLYGFPTAAPLVLRGEAVPWIVMVVPCTRNVAAEVVLGFTRGWLVLFG